MLNDNVLISERTRRQFDIFMHHPAHAVLLEGPKDIGKRDMLSWLAENLSKGTFSELHIVGQLPGTIKIDELKQLKTLLKLQTPDKTTRCILIPDAERMTPESQNSLLKVLEEPPKATYFLLSTSNKQKLLPTIDSRVVKISVSLPTKNEFTEWLTTLGYSSVDSERLYVVTNGAIKKIPSFEDNNDQIIELGKRLLTESVDKRLSELDVILKNDELAQRLPSLLEQILQIGYHSAAEKGKDIHSWISKLAAVEAAETELSYGVNKRVVYTKLLLSL